LHHYPHPLGEQLLQEGLLHVLHVPLPEPFKYDEEISFLTSILPHDGHFTLRFSVLPTPCNTSNFSPQSEHLYSKIGILLLPPLKGHLNADTL